MTDIDNIRCYLVVGGHHWWPMVYSGNPPLHCLYLRERLRSIAMSMSECLCVCLSARISPEPHARSLPNFYACWLRPWPGSRSSSSPPAGWQNSKGRGNFGGFLPNWQCIVQHSIWTHTKTAEPIEMPFEMMSGLSPRNSVLRGGDNPRREMDNFWGKRVPTSLYSW